MTTDDFMKKDEVESRVARWGFAVINAWLLVRRWFEDRFKGGQSNDW